MATRVFLANSRVILLDSLQVLLEIQQDIRIIGKATNGHDAVRRIQKLRPDVAILDIGLIGLNGIEASLKIAGLSPSTAIVMLATTASPEFIFRALRAGARGYLSREASGLELVNAVRTVRQGKRYLSPKITAALIGDYISEHRSPSPLESLTSGRHLGRLPQNRGHLPEPDQAEARPSRFDGADQVRHSARHHLARVESPRRGCQGKSDADCQIDPVAFNTLVV